MADAIQNAQAGSSNAPVPLTIRPNATPRSGVSGISGGNITPNTSSTNPATTINQGIQKQNNVEIYNFLADRPKYYFTIGVGAFSRTSLFNLGGSSNIASVTLPMPNSMNDNHHVQYSLETIGTGTAAAASTVAAGVQSVGQKIGMNIDASAVEKNLKTAGGAGVASLGGIAGDFLQKFTGLNFSGALGAFTGLAKNNFQVIMLQSPTYKKHQFQWKLAAKNEAESRNIKRMVTSLNNNAAPGIVFGGAYFKFPSVFRLAFSDTTNNFLYQFKPAVLEDISVEYAGSGVPAFYKTGAPESVIVRMSFWEMEYWLSGNFK